jgi:hypothetical protein
VEICTTLFPAPGLNTLIDGATKQTEKGTLDQICAQYPAGRIPPPFIKGQLFYPILRVDAISPAECNIKDVAGTGELIYTGQRFTTVLIDCSLFTFSILVIRPHNPFIIAQYF